MLLILGHLDRPAFFQIPEIIQIVHAHTGILGREASLISPSIRILLSEIPRSMGHVPSVVSLVHFMTRLAHHLIRKSRHSLEILFPQIGCPHAPILNVMCIRVKVHRPGVQLAFYHSIVPSIFFLI